MMMMVSKAVAKFGSMLVILVALQIVRAAQSSDLRSGHVLIVENPRATEVFTPQPEPIRRMLNEGVLRFTGKPNAKEAWSSLVATQDVIGIKVHSSPGRMSGTRPAVVSALIESMIEGGIDHGRIIVWDRRSVDLRRAGFYELEEKYQVSVRSAIEEGYDREIFYDTPLLGRLVAGDLEFGEKGEGVGRRSFLSRLLTRQITKIINVPPLLNHSQAGVSGALYGLAMASVDNTLRFDEHAVRLATAVPEIYGMPELADRVVLNIIDALICQYLGEEITMLHHSNALNQLWFSRDPVALDVLALQELDRGRSEGKLRKAAVQIYNNAALMELGVANPSAIKIERIQMK